MGTSNITGKTTMTELAALVSEALEAAGIVATLSGGSAVSVYTENRYVSEDLDFVTTALLEELKPVLEPLGFIHTGSPRLSVFEHPATRWYLEFPPAPLSFGGTYVDASKCAVLSTPAGQRAHHHRNTLGHGPAYRSGLLARCTISRTGGARGDTSVQQHRLGPARHLGGR